MSSNRLRATIIGSGNAGITAAYHLSAIGVDVCLYGASGYAQPLLDIRERGGVRAIEELNGVKLSFAGFQPLHTVTEDIAEAVAFSDVIILPVPSFAQLPLFETMLPHLKDDQIVMLMPGNFGALALRQRQKELGYHQKLLFVDAISIPWACRLSGPAEIAIMGIKEYLPVAALPASRTGEAIERIAPLLPLPLSALPNVIAAGLENINYGGHPLLTTLNMGLLENFEGKFNYYKDCCSVATSRAAEVMELERQEIGNALGLQLMSELEAMNSLYAMHASTVYELNRTSETHGKINSAPDSSLHRYITEDIAYLLVPCQALARLQGVPTPMIDACITIANAYNRTDYGKCGRNLRAMGLAGMTYGQIADSLA